MVSLNSSLKRVLNNQEPCKKCGRCCEYGSGFLIEEDIKNISKFLKIKEEELKEKYLETVWIYNKEMLRPKFSKPYGKCIFLKEKECSIHKVKPLHCKISCCGEKGKENDAWFRINYIVDKKDKNSMSEWKEFVKINKVKWK